MIAKLRGLLDGVTAEGCVIDVGGVGYLVFCSRRTQSQLGAAGSPCALLVDTHVREDHIHLYGFLESGERDWFRLLLTVQGVGGRVALALLGVLSPDQLATAIAAQDKAPLTRADGVGPKLAGRIVAELKDKAGTIALGPAAIAATPGSPTKSAAAAPPVDPAAADQATAQADAVSALVNLGYGRSEAFAAVATAARALPAGTDLSALIPAALKELSQ